MLDTISKVSLPDNTTYDISTAKRDFPLIMGTQTGTTGNWQGQAPSDDFVLQDGQKILYFLNRPGQGDASLQLFKSDGTTPLTDNIPIFLNGDIRLKTQYETGSFITLIYKENVTFYDESLNNHPALIRDSTRNTPGNWWVCTNKNSFMNEIILTAGSNKITPFTLVMRTGTNTYESIVKETNKGVLTNKTVNNKSFYLDSIYYYDGELTISNGDNTFPQKLYNFANINLAYSTNCGNNLVPKQPVFLYGSLTENQKIILDSTGWWVQSLPPNNLSNFNGKVFIFLGIAYSTTNIILMNQHPVYYYRNNQLYFESMGLGTAAYKDVPTSGNASSSQVVRGNDTRLSDARPSSDVIQTYDSSSTVPISGAGVAEALATLPNPMVFKGTVGSSSATITSLPVDGTASVGDTYKVITDGTFGGKTAKVGDTLICNSKTSSANTWQLIPSGDEPSGTVTSVAVSNGGGLSVSGSPVTSSGTITISHADTSSQASVNNSGRTYIQDITLDTYGHITGLTSATETVINTDTKVSQSETTTSNWRKVIVGNQDSATYGTAVATTTEVVYASNKLEYQPSTGTVRTQHIQLTEDIKIKDKVTLQYNTTNDCLDFVFA